MFQLTADEAEALRFQFGTLKLGRGQHRKYLPYAFQSQFLAGETGTVANRHRFQRAAQTALALGRARPRAIMRAFVRLREILSTHKDLAAKLAELEKKLGEHDEKFQIVFEAIRQLMAPPPAPKRRRIGFAPPDRDETAASQATGQAKPKRPAKVR